MRPSANAKVYVYFLTFENSVTNANTNLLQILRITLKVQSIVILIQISIKVETPNVRLFMQRHHPAADPASC